MSIEKGNKILSHWVSSGLSSSPQGVVEVEIPK
jgi:hypothetical protein